METGLNQSIDTPQWAQGESELTARSDLFAAHPKTVIDFLNQRRLRHKKFSPTITHWAISDLQRRFVGRVRVLTENEDNYLEQAKVKSVDHVKGALWQTCCNLCKTRWEDTRCILFPNTCPNCKGKNVLRTTISFSDEPVRSIPFTKLIGPKTLVIALGVNENSALFIGAFGRVQDLDLSMIWITKSIPNAQHPLLEVVLGECKKVFPDLKNLIVRRPL